MLPFKSREPNSSESIPNSPRVQVELALLEQLAFSFDMDNELQKGLHKERSLNARNTRSESVNHSGNTNTVIQSDVQDAALLAQFAAAAGMSPHGTRHPNPFGFLVPSEGYSDSGFDGSAFHENLANTPLPPFSSMDFPWSHFPPPQPHNQDNYLALLRTMSNPGMQSYPYGPGPSSMSTSGAGSSRTLTQHNSASAAPSPTAPPDPENLTEAEHIVSAEEKRRRNTAASARFRIKKKQRATNLERSVSDLTGRAEDLEREAADLRRENGWLKEIVMLKGSRVAGANLASHMTQSNQQPYDEGQSVSHEHTSSEDEDGTNAGKKNKKKGKK